MQSMWDTAKYLCANIQGCKLAYTQSDEITLLLTDYATIDTEAWFDANSIKMISVSASMATLAFNNAFEANAKHICMEKGLNLEVYQRKFGTALFDSRAFTIPKEEVCNNFIWRQQDASRNAVQMIGQAKFSHKELQGKSCAEIQEMLFQNYGLNFNDLPVPQKRGICVVKTEVEGRGRWVVDDAIPIFTQDREYIEKYL